MAMQLELVVLVADYFRAENIFDFILRPNSQVRDM